MKTLNFVHLHVHSDYSIMNGCASVQELVDAAIKNRMPGIAITDDGNMFGALNFFNYVSRINTERQKKGKKPFKPVIGSELYVAKGSKTEKTPNVDCKGSRLIVLAKNVQGYHNLVKLVSNAWTDGFYKRPRTDRADLEKYHEGLIVLSGGMGSEVFSHILNDDMVALDETIKWYQRVFADDYYLELQRNVDGDDNCNVSTAPFPKNPEERDKRRVEMSYDPHLLQQKMNMVLMQKGKQHGVKVVATNDVHYVKAGDVAVYNILRSAATGKTLEDYTHHAPLRHRWLRSKKEMRELFSDVPEATSNTMEIFDKVEFYDIHHILVAPSVGIPKEAEADELQRLAFARAQQIYGNPLPEEVASRLRFELQVIKQRGASGYFLFWQDVILAAQSELGVMVGPGRGSSAGSLVAFCLGITKIDPLKYDLLFERFINPDGVLFPDIDVDFDEEGRERVLEWIEKKYGKECCAYIVSFAVFTIKAAFKMVAQAMQLPASVVDIIIRAIPQEYPYFRFSIKDIIKYHSEAKKAVRKADESVKAAIDYTALLQRKIRGLGVHACGFVVSNGPVSNWAPLSICSLKDAQGHSKILNCVQYEGRQIEDTGLLKMDFLGLPVLSLMRDVLQLIKERKGVDVNIEQIPVDDAKTFELFQEGQTHDVFQFDTDGMRRCLMDLHPDNFDELVLMNVMFRIGPLQYFPLIVKRKRGKSKIKYAIPCMEKYLGYTYGMIAYQEQIMQLACSIAGFSQSDSDNLRKAIGRKAVDVIAVMKERFIQGGIKNGYLKKDLGKVWRDIERQGCYAFNKSHAVCYTWLAYQMTYLKAHYPEEFQSVMSLPSSV